MKTVFYVLLMIITQHASAQKSKEFSLALMNTASAKPFAKFSTLVTQIHQPGVELGYVFNWKTKTKHDWYQEIKLGFVYHRFVQNAISLYTDVGYRYKLNKKWCVQSAIGLGYIHSIPATAQLKLGSNGDYTNAKGIGRMQGMAAFNIGTSYTFSIKEDKPLKLFVTYQQIIQTPFINEYVPLLPYNSILVGIGIPLQSKKLKS